MGLAWIWLMACSTTDAPEPSDPAAPSPRPGVGELLIEELYTAGAAPAGGADHYFNDQFVELINPTTRTLDLSGVKIGEVFGSAGEINAGMEPDSYRAQRPDEVVVTTVWEIPDGVALEPGQTLVIAHDGVNHRPFSTVDLAGAALESYAAASGEDEDNARVDNLVEVTYHGGYDWLMTVFGPSVVLLHADVELEPLRGGGRYAAPVDAVLDGVDTLMDARSRAFKRLPDAVDVGFGTVDGVYIGRSLRRVRDAAGRPLDRDDSAIDFEVADPSPSIAVGDATGGAGWVRLGAGGTSFIPLADGDPVELVAGPQGGFHVDVGLQFGGFGPGGVVLSYDAVDPATAQRVSFVTEGLTTAASVTVSEDGWERLGDRVVLDVRTADEAVGRELVLRVTGSVDGAAASDERRVVIVDLL
jgi:hypothetical protein